MFGNDVFFLLVCRKSSHIITKLDRQTTEDFAVLTRTTAVLYGGCCFFGPGGPESHHVSKRFNNIRSVTNVFGPKLRSHAGFVGSFCS